MKNIKKYFGVLLCLTIALILIPNMVLADNYGEDFSKILTNGKLVINSIPPKNVEESWHIIYEIPFYDQKGNALYDDLAGSFSVDEVSDDYKRCTITYRNKSTYEVIESHEVEIVYNYDEEILKIINKFIETLPEEKEYYEVSDLELINFWINGKNDEYNNIDNYSTELKSYFKNTNLEFYIDNRAGFDGTFLEGRMGIATISYKGIVYYIDYALSTRAASVIYVDDNSTDPLKDAQKRINDYLGSDKYKISRVGIIADYITQEQEKIRNEWYQAYQDDLQRNNEQKQACLQYNQNNPENCNYLNNASLASFEAYIENNHFSFDYNEELNTLADFADYDYYKVTINGIDRYFVIVKDSEGIRTPSYLTSDIETNISISSNATSIPLDSYIKSQLLTSGADVDKITKILNNKNVFVYDINLYSKSLADNITKLDNGKFKVSIPVPAKFEGKNLIIYYVNSKDEVEEHEVTIENGYATFETDHFSTYTLAVKNISNPKTYDDIARYFIILGVCVIAVVSYVIYKKKK